MINETIGIFGFTQLEFVLMLVFVMMMPIYIVGLVGAVNWIAGIMKVRSGHIKIRKVLANDQTVEFWVRPQGKKISLRDKSDRGVMAEREMEVDLSKDYLKRNGGTPYILLDSNNVQIPWRVGQIGKNVPQEIVDEIADTAFSSGMMIGFKGMKQMGMLVILVCGVGLISLVGIIVGYYFWTNPNVISQVVQVTTQVLNITTSNTTNVTLRI